MQDTDKDQNARIQARGMLTGRRIAVTGGAGAIGAAIARHQSIAFFANPREDMSIECIPTCMSEDNPPRHPPVQAGAYLLKKIRAAAGD